MRHTQPPRPARCRRSRLNPTQTAKRPEEVRTRPPRPSCPGGPRSRPGTATAAWHQAAYLCIVFQSRLKRCRWDTVAFVTTLIVATDGSDLALQAALAGLSLTKRADKVLVVCAVDLVGVQATMTYENAQAINNEKKAAGQTAVAETAEALRDIGYTPEQVEVLVVEGGAGPALCRLAADVGASALIVGSHGLSGLKRVLLGSVSDYIVRNAPCSVVVSRNRES